MARRPHLVINPHDDGAFVEVVGRLASGAQSPGDLETALRGAYPAAAVNQRDLSAESIVVWYVYRDGHWIRPGSALRG